MKKGKIFLVFSIYLDICYYYYYFFFNDEIHIVAEKRNLARRSNWNSNVTINILKNLFISIASQRYPPET